MYNFSINFLKNPKVFDFFLKKKKTLNILKPTIRKKSIFFLRGGVNEFIFSKKSNNFFTIFCLNGVTKFKSKSLISKKKNLNNSHIDHKNHRFLKKSLMNEIVKFNIAKYNNLNFQISNNIIYFFIHKHIFFNKLSKLIFPKKNINDYNNRIPVNYLHKPLRRLIFTKFQKSYTPDFFKYIHLFLINYLESICKSPIFFKVQSKIKIHSQARELLNTIFLKHRNFQSKIGRGFFFFEMLEII